MASNIPLDSGPNNTGGNEIRGHVRVQLPLGQAADYPRTDAIIMGLLEAGFALIPHGNLIHAKHKASGEMA